MNSNELSPWRRRQIAMLYRFASLEYLLDIQRMISQLISGEHSPGIDKMVAAARVRMTRGPPMHNDPKLWERNSRDVLEQMQSLLAEDIKQHASGRYIAGSLGHFFTQVARSDAYDTLRMMDEYHVYSELVYDRISPTEDILVNHRRQNSVDDYWFAHLYANFVADRPRIPKFRIRTDISVESGACPPRAGVYVCANDPNAAPQFAWPGGDRGTLTDSSTFNEVGLAALAAVGRESLWFDQNKMVEFVRSKEFSSLFDDRTRATPELAIGAVASISTVRSPAAWHFVEIEQEDFEDSALGWHQKLVSQPDAPVAHPDPTIPLVPGPWQFLRGWLKR